MVIYDGTTIRKQKKITSKTKPKNLEANFGRIPFTCQVFLPPLNPFLGPAVGSISFLVGTSDEHVPRDKVTSLMMLIPKHLNKPMS